MWSVLCALLLACLGAGSVSAELLELRQARWLDPQGAPQDISLPWVWDKVIQNRSGSAHLVLSWTLPQRPSVPMALFIPKAGNAFELRFNGWLFLKQGDVDLAGSQDHAKLPQWVAVPTELLAQHNVIELRLRADAGRRAGLSSVWVGPYHEIKDKYEWQRWERWAVTLFILTLSLGVGLLAFAFAWTQRGLVHPQDLQNRFIFMVAGMAETSWSFRLADSVWVEPPLPWSVWSVLSSLSYLVWIASALVFCHHACEVRLRGLRTIVLVFVFGGVLSAAVSRWWDMAWPWTLWMACTAAGLIIYGLWFSAHLLRQPTPLRALVALAAVANIGAGAWNWWVFRWLGNPTGEGSFQRYTSLLFTLALLVILLQRFRSASLGARDNIEALNRRIAERESELAIIYQRQELSVREQERQQERVRIWRDLHDGLGAHLSSALRLVQADRFDPKLLSTTLKDSLMQLKLSVDAASLPSGDLGVILGSLRYRLAPAFEAAGLVLVWEVQALPTLPLLDSPHALREIQFMVYEALSNVLQHAQAQHLTIQARPCPEGVLLIITDDGRGWTQTEPPGKGLRSMHDRSAALGLQLTVSSEKGRTSVSWLIPYRA